MNLMQHMKRALARKIALFVAAIYFMFCFAMSRYSRRLEAQTTRAK